MEFAEYASNCEITALLVSVCFGMYIYGKCYFCADLLVHLNHIKFKFANKTELSVIIALKITFSFAIRRNVSRLQSKCIKMCLGWLASFDLFPCELFIAVFSSAISAYKTSIVVIQHVFSYS